MVTQSKKKARAKTLARKTCYLGLLRKNRGKEIHFSFNTFSRDVYVLATIIGFQSTISRRGVSFFPKFNRGKRIHFS